MALTADEVSRHLPATLDDGGKGGGGAPFDVVVFDEASQLPTAQALGAVGRAGQCIVAGDDRQLPPPGGVPGLLDGCLAVGLPLLPLDFHYRSSAQSLIALSNHLFYFGTLKSFPSAHAFGRRLPRDAPLRRAQEAAGAAGVHGLVRVRCDGPMESNAGTVADVQAVLCALPWRDADTRPHYSASPQGFVNVAQAQQSVALLAKYLDDLGSAHGGGGGGGGRPMSVGVLTLNRPQRNLIHSMVDACKGTFGVTSAGDHAWRRDGSRGAHPSDVPLFIQSIDQIQGEERDLIVFATASRRARPPPPRRARRRRRPTPTRRRTNSTCSNRATRAARRGRRRRRRPRPPPARRRRGARGRRW